MLRHPTITSTDNFTWNRSKLNYITYIHITRRNYFKNKFRICKSDVRTTWSNINGIIYKDLNRGGDINNVFRDRFISVSDPNVVVNNFCNLFVNLDHSLASKTSSNTSFKKRNKSAGPDDLHKPSILRFVINYIVRPLTHIINLSFSTRVFPLGLRSPKLLQFLKRMIPKRTKTTVQYLHLLLYMFVDQILLNWSPQLDLVRKSYFK